MDYAELLKIISPILVGFISAYCGSLLALNKFKKEKFWDERRSSYKAAIEALEELLHWSEQVRAEHYCEPSNNVKAEPELALRVISKLARTGNLIFSTKFSETLKTIDLSISRAMFQIHDQSLGDCGSDRERAEWHLIEANEIRKIVEENLPSLIKLAKDELPKKT